MASATERGLRAYHHRQQRKKMAEEQAVIDAGTNIPKGIIEFVQKTQAEPSFFIESCLSVVPLEGGDLVPFVLNPGQRLVLEAVEKQIADNRPIRIIVLKSRRQGISTLGEALVYWATSCFPFRNGIVVAHKKDVSSELFRMAKLFYSGDTRHRLGIAPEVVASNELAIRFDTDRKQQAAGRQGLRSSMVVETAEGTGVARGLTLHAGHFSEVASWQNPGIMTGLMIALSNTPGSIGVIESTAEGVGNVFEQTWTAAVKGRNEWTPVFLSWLIDPHNQMPVSDAEIRSWDFTDRAERDLYEKHGASLEQLKWRRATVNSPKCFRPGYRPEEIFRQEFPTTPEEAFLTSGNNFFLIEGLERLAESGKGPKDATFVGSLQTQGLPADRSKEDWKPIVRAPVADRYGDLYVWEAPEPGEDYVLGGDVAEGVEQDASVAWVLKRSTLKFVARLKSSKIDPDEFGQRCALLGWWYNTALVGVEWNGPGIATNGALRRLHYARMWFDRDLTRLDEPMQNRVGWRTTSANRRSILDRLEEEIRTATIDMPSPEFFDEARKFLNVDGRPQAAVGSHDDEIMAAAIAVQIHVRGGALRGQKAVKRLAEPRIDPVAPKARAYARRQIRALEWF